MVIEYQNQEIVIRLPGSMDRDAVRKVVDYFNALEIISQNQGTEEQASELAREVEANWWKANKQRFLP
jgi:hypothetical protein